MFLLLFLNNVEVIGGDEEQVLMDEQETNRITYLMYIKFIKIKRGCVEKTENFDATSFCFS